MISALFILTGLVIIGLGAVAPVYRIILPYREFRKERSATAWWQAAQERKAEQKKEQEEKNKLFTDVEQIAKGLEKRLIQEMARLGIRYRYKSHETRKKKKAHYQYIQIKTKLIGLDYVTFPFLLPQDKKPSDVLDETFQDNLRINTNRPDLRIHSTPRDGLFCFIPLRGSADGIPNYYEWNSAQSHKDAMSLLPANKPFAMPIGLGANRVFRYLDLTDPSGSSAHILVAGTSGGGKSNLSAAWLCSLLVRNSPEMLRFVMIDLKLVELHPYRAIPHLQIPIVQRPHQVGPAFQAVYDEMEERLQLFTSRDCKSIHDWNDKAAPHEHVPYLFVWVDELALVMQVVDKKTEEKFSQLSALGRAAGIHIAAFTQRPSVDVVSGLVKTNMPDRVAFNSDEHGSKVMLGNVMAKGLTPKGRAIFYTQGEYHSLQTPFIYNEQVAYAVSKAMKYAPPPRRLLEPELWQLMIDKETKCRPEILHHAQKLDPDIDMIRLSNMLWPHHYSLKHQAPLIEHNGHRYLLWHSRLIDVTDAPLPQTPSDIEEMLCLSS